MEIALARDVKRENEAAGDEPCAECKIDCSAMQDSRLVMT